MRYVEIPGRPVPIGDSTLRKTLEVFASTEAVP
jgi:hypothetical protein